MGTGLQVEPEQRKHRKRHRLASNDFGTGLTASEPVGELGAWIRRAHHAHSQYVEGDTLTEMIQEDLIAEGVAIESYSEIVRYLGKRDPASRRMMEEILAKEEEHGEDMKLSSSASADRGCDLYLTDRPSENQLQRELHVERLPRADPRRAVEIAHRREDPPEAARVQLRSRRRRR
jgi:Ferritin-like domain